jgi:peptidase E
MKFKFGAAALAAAALVAAGCGSGSSGTTTTSTSSAKQSTAMSSMDMASNSSSGKGAVDSGSSGLRATLTAGLQEHVYLAGIAVDQAVEHGLTSPQFKAAAATLDKNTVALSQAIGSVYGNAAGAKFLKLWRQHIGFFVDYTKGRATDDSALVAKAQKELDGYRAQFAAFLASANPNLTAAAVSNDLKGHVATLEAAIDAVVAKKANAFALLQDAAMHMSGTADVLAGAISKQYPKKFSGSASSAAATLRAALTAQLQEHVYLAGITVAQGVGHGLTSPQFKAAAGALDKNSVNISDSIGSVYGNAAGKQFLQTWRRHIGFFVDYTKGKATKNAALVKKANQELDGYVQQSAAFLHKANPKLPAAAVANDLQGHIATLKQAIDAVVAGKANAFDLLQGAAQHMSGTADVLAGAIAKQYPMRFPS